MAAWKNWDSHRLTPYLHWCERLDENGNPQVADGKGLWCPRVGVKPRNDPDTELEDLLQQTGLPLPPELKQLITCVPPIENDPPVGNVSDIDVLVAVADTDIPLGHRAFRDAAGGSRVLYHWQMEVGGGGGTAWGRTFWKEELDTLLRAHSGGDLDGELDAQAFNTATGTLDVRDPRGHHALLGRFAHGAHVLDTAGGSNPHLDPDFSKKVGLITVGLPPRWDFGEAGEFLDIIMFRAVLQIFVVSRAIWKKKRPKGPKKGELYGLPTVLNLAFGRQAGSKRDDGGWFPVLLKSVVDLAKSDVPRTPPSKPAPFDVVMPAGNDNLGQVVARFELKPGETKDLPWRHVPGDQSDNYVEVWAEDKNNPGGAEAELGIAVALPGAGTAEPVTIPVGAYLDVWSDDRGHFGARVYREVEPFKTGSEARRRPGYIVATGPCDPRSDALAAVPSGPWTIRVENKGPDILVVEFSVQTDQSVLPIAGSSGRAYLEDDQYRVFDDEGRLVDAVRWDRRKALWERAEGDTGVLRHGTINAAASTTIASIIGGYRRSDGMPASYSATGSAEYGRTGLRGAPTVTLPTDDSAVLGGVPGAGAGDSTRLAMRGTSFASAQATRTVAEAWLHSRGPLDPAQDILSTAAIEFEKTDPYKIPSGNVRTDVGPAYPKLAHGRVPAARDLQPDRREPSNHKG